MNFQMGSPMRENAPSRTYPDNNLLTDFRLVCST
jgi:hypothetical protein